MRKVIHFKTQEERLKYLKGELEEVVPKKADNVKSDEKRQKSASKGKKKQTKEDK